MKTFKWLLTSLIIGAAFTSNAQDGQKLFEAKCNVCHSLEKNSTGPKLQGVRAKWEEAGELEYLYEWVQNAPVLITSGKSSMAAAIKDFSPTSMTPQQVTTEEIDAILAYVDAWVPEAPAAEGGTATQETGEVVYVPNYKKNLNLFYALCILTIFLLVAIITMAGSVTRFVKSDIFRDRLRDTDNVAKTLVLLVVFTGVAASNTFALQFNGPGESTEDMPWLLIENSDLYALLIVDIILVGVLFYVKRMFKTFIGMTIKSDEAAINAEGEVLKKVNHILTDVVPIEEEHTILMQHEYDGIRELDNNLPPWWVWGFYGTIVFAVVYLLNYHVFKSSDLQIEAYNKEMKQAEAQLDAYRKANAMDINEDNVVILEDDADISAGKTIFANTCALCHSDNGEGVAGSGPNLTDKYWIYGYDIKDVFTTVKYGRPAGMPEHKGKLNPVQMQQVSSFVLQLPEKAGVEPKGDIVEK